MAKREAPPVAMSFRQMDAICRRLSLLADQMDFFTESMTASGFQAFRPRQEYLASFCNSGDERALRKRCIAERAKQRLAAPLDMNAFGSEASSPWRSPFLQALREEQTKGLSIDSTTNDRGLGEMLRQEIDPCQRNLLRMQWQDRETWDAIFTSMHDAELQALADEATAHATGLGRMPHTFDAQGRYAFFSAVMARDASPLGFQHDKRRSKPEYPVFTKPLTPDWDLCWSIEERTFFQWNQFEGRFEPALTLRSRTLRGRSSKIPGQILGIDYPETVHGFGNGYRTFRDLDELETAIKAHLKLYELTFPTIEDAIKAVLMP